MIPHSQIMAVASDVGLGFTINCLPVSLLVLERYPNSLPNARVVIGSVCYPKNVTYGDEVAIRNFVSLMVQQPPDYHAWIETPDGGLYDYTLGVTWESRLPGKFLVNVIREQDAQEIGLIYKPVLTADVDVAAFGAALKRAHSVG